MSIDVPLHLPDQPVPHTADTTHWDGLDSAHRPAPGRGPEITQLLAAAAAVLDELPSTLGQLTDEQLTDAMGTLMRLHARAGQVAALATSDADARGAIGRSDAANTTQWVTGCAQRSGVPIEPAQATSIAKVAQACRDRRNHVIVTAMSEGACTLATARTALRQTEKVAEVLPTAARDEIQSWFLQLDPAMGSRGVTELTRRIIARYEPDKLSAQDARLERVESLTWRTLPTGMLRLTADLCPANAVVVKQALTSLSAPRPARKPDRSEQAARDADPVGDDATEASCSGPGSAAGVSGAADARSTADADAGVDARSDADADADVRSAAERVPDERTPGKRRLDALLDLVSAGAKVARGDGTNVGAAATVLLTMDLHALQNGVDQATTIGGETLDAGAARRLACDADLIPIVLGGPSQPLDVGRQVRLVTGGMRAAVVHRDQGCTFPGCDRPPGFCEVHHVLPWWAGGGTSLANSAMLCCRHHQVVHRRGYTATVGADGVVWDLTVGAMPGWRADLVA